MLRIQRNILARMLLVLRFMKSHDMTLNDAWRDLRDTDNRTNDDEYLLDLSMEGGDIDKIDPLIDQLTKQVFSKDVNTDGELVEGIVDAVQGTYGRSVLSGSTLEALRRAVLIPGEVTGLNERLRQKELHCCSCAKEIQRGEMVSFIRDGNHTLVWCARCSLPSTSACSHKGCSKVIAIPDQVLRSLNKSRKCEEHRGGVGEEVTTSMNTVTWGGLDTINADEPGEPLEHDGPLLRQRRDMRTQPFTPPPQIIRRRDPR